MRLPLLDDLPDAERVLVRSDLNVPISDGAVVDDQRIEASLPTYRALLDRGFALVICAHLGRPEGEVDRRYSLAPVAEHLGEMLETDVQLGPDDVAGDKAAQRASALRPGDVLLLENIRFDPGERSCEDGFVDRLVRLADCYVDDAFGACHREHASIVGPPARLPSAAGSLLQREIEVLGGLRDAPEQPFVAVLGGAKVADKLDVVAALAERCDTTLVGGKMAMTFLAASGRSVDDSQVEDDWIERCRELLDTGRIRLPVDLVVTESLDDGSSHHVVDIDDGGGDLADEWPDGWLGADLGPRTADTFAEALDGARTVFWNGPLGVVEQERFAAGTRRVADAIAGCDGYSVVGGGETISALKDLDLVDRIDHVSTGGGAALEFVADGDLPGLRALRDASRR